MAINKVLQAALKVLSYPDLDMRKHYKLQRSMVKALHFYPVGQLYTTFDHKIEVGDHEVPVRMFTPESEGPHKVLLFFHGGGWVTGNIDTYNRLCTNLTKFTGHCVVSVDYRLAPEYPFPAGLEDCYGVAKALFENPQWLGVEADDITLIGDSAGGNLAAALSLMARDRGEFVPKRQILLYPATFNDHSEDSPFASVRENGTDYLLTSKHVEEFMQLYAGDPANRENPYFSPLLCDDLSGQPETLLITAQYDPLRDEGEEYGRALKRAGNRVEAHRATDGLHGFLSLPATFESVQECLEIIRDFLEKSYGEGTSV